MTESLTIEVEFPVGEDNRFVEINIDCEYIVENNGIGAYEYWGFKGNDCGVDYVVIEETNYDSTPFTAEENDLIKKEIEKSKPSLEDQIMERLSEKRKESACFYSDED